MRYQQLFNRQRRLRLAFALDFRAFFERVFLEVEPRVKLVDSKFIDVMVDRLKQVLSGSSRRLIINLPPRHLKSLLDFCCVCCLCSRPGSAKANGCDLA